MIYTREELIDLAERGLKQATVDKWRNRDSAGACQQLGEALGLLYAGADFEIQHGQKLDFIKTDDNTVWVEFTFPGFSAFEYGRTDLDEWESETYYIPTASRLERGGDWY